jgi:hypothetical protein
MSESTGTPHGDEEVFELSVEVPPSVGHDAVSINAYLTQLANDLNNADHVHVDRKGETSDAGGEWVAVTLKISPCGTKGGGDAVQGGES